MMDNNLLVSQMAEELVGSEIIKLAFEINERIKKGDTIYNFTIGDFDPEVFPIPYELTNHITQAYEDGQTNYPPSNGMGSLRRAISAFYSKWQGLHYDETEILVSGGSRPLIYAVYQTILDPGDAVIFPVPSWNNNHYCHLTKAHPVMVETSPENNFMPNAADIQPFIGQAALLSLCSPLNPTGTVLTEEVLRGICQMVLAENEKRKAKNDKPLYVMYDQVYWLLTHGETVHCDPVNLYPEMKEYTIYVDGLSKALAGTGVRVGWACGPRKVINKMKAILSHIGAWAPKAEQVATGKYLQETPHIESYLTDFKTRLNARLQAFYDGFIQMKKDGFNVDAIPPQAAIYLTVKINLNGMQTAEGRTLQSPSDTNAYLLDEAKLALVPFTSFGASPDSTWYRLSVGTAKTDEIENVFRQLREALAKLKMPNAVM